TPTPPTSNATAPRPSSSAVSVVSMACLAVSASEGRDTSTSLGCSGVAVAARVACTATTASSRVRGYTGGGDPSHRRGGVASGQPTRAARARSGGGGAEGVQHADEGEPRAAEPHLGAGGGAGHAEALGGHRPEHHRRVPGGGLVEPGAAGQVRAHGGGQVGPRGEHRQVAGLVGG